MSLVAALPRRSVLLEDVDWQTYGHILDLFDEHPGMRFTYDRGRLEIMAALSLEHEDDAGFLGRLVEFLTEELEMAIRGGKSTTLRRQMRQRGLEPDECFWIANAFRMRGRRRIDLNRDPPPDLAIEVVVTHAIIDRLEVYAGLAVPEVWRLRKNQLRFYVLDHGDYVQAQHSKAFPMVTPNRLMTFLQRAREAVNQNTVISEFRTWLRKQRPAH